MDLKKGERVSIVTRTHVFVCQVLSVRLRETGEVAESAIQAVIDGEPKQELTRDG